MSKPNIILHIGAEKTGTTSIQKLLASSPQSLSPKIRFPFEDELPDTIQGRHVGLNKASGCSYFWKNNPFENRTSSIREEYRKKYFEKVAELSKRCSHEKRNYLILSEESLSSRLKYSEIDCITRELSKSFDKRYIVLIMRDQFKAYISQYSTFIVNKKSDSLKKFLIDHQNSDYFNYHGEYRYPKILFTIHGFISQHFNICWSTK
jgi:hypothetical protein